jgi:hypothetical protein
MINKSKKHKVMMNIKNGDLAEMTRSWFGDVIWLVDFESINPGTIAKFPIVIYSDDERFNDYVQIGWC